jgi:hypothetical protein
VGHTQHRATDVMTGDFDRRISRWVYRLGASLVGVLYLLGTLGRAHQKLFWHDEIFTVVLAQLGPAALWGALRTATDLNPPAFYLATRAGEMIFGRGLIGSRMPAVMGVLAAALCAGLFVRRRYGPFAGLVTILLFLGTDAYLYSYEARPYGLVLGLAGAALVCWQSTSSTSPVRYAGAVAGLCASLTIAIACHYYAVLLLIPIAAAEVSRFLRRRQPRWPVWIGTGVALAPALVCWPLIASAREYSAGFFAPPSLRTVLDSVQSTISPLLVPLLVMLVVVSAVRVFGGLSDREAYSATAADEQDEWVLAATLVTLPLLAYACAVVWTHALVARYYLPWTLGFSILVTITIARSGVGNRVLPVMAIVLLGWVGARQALSARWLVRPSPDLRAMYPTLVDQSNGEIPVVIGHSHVFLVAQYYAPPPLASRLVKLTWADAPGTPDTSTRAFRRLQRLRPLRLDDFDTFIRHHRHFLFYGPTPDPVLDKIRRAGGLAVLRRDDEDTQLFPMSRPGPYTLFEVTFVRADGRDRAGRPGQHRPADEAETRAVRTE